MFYSINHSLNIKIVGKFFQSEDIYWNYGNIDNPNLLNNIYFKKVEFDPIVPIPILHKKSKITDLISCVNATCSGQLIISNKLKNILEKQNNNGFQFFKTQLIQNGNYINDFFVLNIWNTNMEYINFTKSLIYYEKQREDFMISYKTDIILLNITNVSELMKYIEIANIKAETISIEKLKILDDINDNFFMIKHPVKFIVSEKLKQEIEDASCTGIEFQPVELSYNEWTMPGGEREKVYGKM